MTRRNLFRTLTAAVVASSMELMGWRPRGIPKVIINPEWANAKYEEQIIFHPSLAQHFKGLLPRRYDTPDLNAESIPPYILSVD